MSSLLTVDGMVHRSAVITSEVLFGRAVLDDAGRALVSLADVFALVQLDACAEIVLVDHGQGVTSALRVSEVLTRGDMFIQVTAAGVTCADEWQVRLWSADTGSSLPVVSLCAMSFASFVGCS